MTPAVGHMTTTSAGSTKLGVRLHRLVLIRGSRMQDIGDMKLVHMTNRTDMDDADTVSGLKVENDDVLGLCYRRENAEGACRDLSSPRGPQ